MPITSSIKRIGLLLLVTIIAIATLYLAYPRLSSSLRYIPVDAALKRNWEDYPIKQGQFPALIEISQKAIEELDHSRYWQGLGWLHYLQVYTLDFNTPEARKTLNQSKVAFEIALKKSPADPASWLRLAWVHALLNNDRSSIVKTLKMSFYTGRAERYLILNRLDLALQYAGNFQQEELPLIRDQVQLAWRFFPADTLRLIRSGTFDQYTLIGLIANTNPNLAKEIKEKL